ncbi:MAG TPA: mechanosensitive ion channel family protein [Vicinamibacteria bacterium]|jgi:MscS family membrane protein
MPKPAGTPEAQATAAPAPEPEASDSPRAAGRAFLELTTRKGDYAGAARYLVLPQGEEARGPELARRLRAVLERHVDVDLDALSPASDGEPKDGLPDGVDLLGQLPDGHGGQDPVFLVRVRAGSGHAWAFSRQTVARVDEWYDALPDRWIRDRIPQRLQRYGPWGVMWWQWLALPALVTLALAAGRVIGATLGGTLQRLFRHTPTQWDEGLLQATSPAFRMLLSVAAAAVSLPWLGLLPGPNAALRSLLVGLATFGAFWVLWRAIDVWARYLNARPWAIGNPSARSLLSVMRSLARVFVAVTGLVATLAAFGYPVATMLAGLGIGGIAIAFGAQKTIENLFGSIALAADQPFRVGDFVRIEDSVSGNVERIGMRSTQVRTLDRTVVSIPNGKLADMRIETFGARDRIRFAATIGLVFGTREDQLRRIVSGVEALLRASPKVWPESVVSSFAALSPSSLDIEVLCWFETPDYAEFRELRQQVLFGIMRIVEEAGASFAFPTRTVHVVGEPPGARG